MKKNFKKLVLNKSTLSNLENNQVLGGKPITQGITCWATCNGNATCNYKEWKTKPINFCINLDDEIKIIDKISEGGKSVCYC